MCRVYIAEEWTALVLSGGRDLWSLLSQEGEPESPGPVGGEFWSTCSGSSGRVSRARDGPALSKLADSYESLYLVCTVSGCEPDNIRTYRATELQS